MAPARKAMISIDTSPMLALAQSLKGVLSEKGIEKVLYRTLKRTGEHARTLVARDVQRDYHVDYGYQELETQIQAMRDRADGLIIKNSENVNSAMARLMQTTFKDNFTNIWDYGTILDQELARVQNENPNMGYLDALELAKKSDKLPKISDEDMTAFNAWWGAIKAAMDGMNMDEAKAYYQKNGGVMPPWVSMIEDIYQHGLGVLGTGGGSGWNNWSPERRTAFIMAGGTMAIPSTEDQQYAQDYQDAASLQKQQRDEWYKGYSEQVSQLAFSQGKAFWIEFNDYYKKNKDQKVDIPEFIQAQEDIDAYLFDVILDQFVKTKGIEPSSTLMFDAFGNLITQSGDLGTAAGKAYSDNFSSAVRLNGGYGTANNGTARGGGGQWVDQLFAEGGRAVEASIFGEAGPEWAIPESHNIRTAELLNAARTASGFSWPELIAATGGLGGNPNNGGGGSQFVYAPEIHVKDARGVERVLQEDKQRMDAWWEKKQRETERKSW